MNREEQERVHNYLEIYADAFNGMVREMLSRNSSKESDQYSPLAIFDPERLKSVIGDYSKVDAKALIDSQVSLMQQHMNLWQSTSRAMIGLENVEPTVTEEPGDRRFGDSEWKDNPVYSYIKQAYLLNSKMLTNIVDSIEFEDDQQAQKARFYTRQYISAVSPTNLAATNPEVCREILETKGENLAKGMENFMRDFQQSPTEALKITQSDPDAFTLGENLATTPGKVIFQNELIQLIQYQPSTKEVYEVPLLLIPPFINKYYIMDLDQKKSLVRWLVSQNFTVFMVSWVNPDATLSDTKFEDYVVKGIGAALDVAENISGSNKVNAVGYCVGGTLLAIAQSWLRAKGDERLHSCSFFTTLTDFSEPGEIGVYLSEEILPLLEKKSRTKGIFDGRILALSFNLLRENDLFWSYFINNYLKGKDPVAFDILYWNSDSTNIPAETFVYFLRNLYMENKLIEPGGISVDDIPIDLANVDTPSYFVATVADHIVPWQASYRSSQKFSGPVRFVLGGSGHVAGVINPPEPGKYPHWINEESCADAESWQQGATEVSGSWWPDWKKWLEDYSGSTLPARKPGKRKKYPILEDAPGSYVKVRI